MLTLKKVTAWILACKKKHTHTHTHTHTHEKDGQFGVSR